MFYLEDGYDEIAKAVVLVDYSPGYKLGDFDCGVDDYNEFLVHDASLYIEQNICQIKLLIDKQSADVIGYMALSADSFRLDEEIQTLQQWSARFFALGSFRACREKRLPLRCAG